MAERYHPWLDVARSVLSARSARVVGPDGSVSALPDLIYGEEEGDAPAGVLLDVQTANVLLAVHERMPADAQAKFASLALPRAVRLAWSCVSA